MLRCIVVAGMGFHQLAVRCLSWLVLNHLQLLIVALVKRSFEPKSKKHIMKEVSVKAAASLFCFHVLRLNVPFV